MQATRSAIISLFIILCLFSLACITLYLDFGTKECHEGSFLCEKSDVCMANKYKCNLRRDCFYGEDEDRKDCADLYGIDSYNKAINISKTNHYDKIIPCALEVYPTKCDCLHGISLRCNKIGLNKVPRNISKNVKKLSLIDNNIELSDDSFDGYKSLTVIHLQHNKLTRIPPFVFKHQNRLIWLFLLNNNLKTLEKDALQGLNSVVNLFLDHNQLEFLNLKSWQHMIKLTWADLSDNSLTLTNEYFPYLTKLVIVHLQRNRIKTISELLFADLPSLESVNLSDNMITSIHVNAFQNSIQLKDLDLSNNKIKYIPSTMLGSHSLLSTLSLGYNPIEKIYADIFKNIQNLNSLNLTGIDKENIEMKLFEKLKKLKFLYLKEFHYCIFYARNVGICKPNIDGLSSSLNLLPKPILRWTLWLVTVFTLLMNALVLYGRIFGSLRDENPAISFVIRNLAVADMLMSIYLTVIGYHDAMYRNKYYIYDQAWKFSFTCTAIGIIAVVSSEVSLLILVFLSFERFLLIAVPLSGYRVLKLKTAIYCMVSIWLVGSCISVAPLLLWKHSSKFYGSNGLCYPLYIEDPFVVGWQYSAFMFLGLHTTSLILMSILYALMFISIWKTRQAARISVGDLDFAVRFFFIVLANFFCWLPIIVLKILAFRRFPISSVTYGWVIVFVVPINALVNPLLYTFTTPKYRNMLTSKKIFKLPYRDSSSGAENSQTSYFMSLYSRNFKKNTKINSHQNTFEVTDGE